MNHRHLRQMIYLSLLALLPVSCASAPIEPTTTPIPPPPTAAETPTPVPVPPTDAPASADQIAQVAQAITWLRSTNPYGHTAIKIQSDDRVIYLDPVDLVGIKDLPKADIILITHEHGDHLSLETVAALSKAGTKVVSIERVTRLFSDLEAVTLSAGDKVTVDGLEIDTRPAYNASHPKISGHLGFIFSIQGVRIYCSGDTSLNPETEALTGIDIAVLNIRAPYSLSGKEAVQFAEIVKPKIIIPIHWMPEDNTYHDQEEIGTIRQNIPSTTLLSILDLEPSSP